MKSRKLSNLELTVLGLAWLRGPCTIYTVMRELSMSESSYHRGRAGTAYSVAHRLIKFQFLSEEDGQVSVTPSGLAQLQNWLATPVPRQDIAHTVDLIRLRFFFLEAVDQAQRLAFIDDALAGLKEFLVNAEKLLPENEAIGDYFGVLASLSVVLETRARIEWLETVRHWVESPIEARGDWSAEVLKSF